VNELIKTLIEIGAILIQIPLICCTAVATIATTVATFYAAKQVRATRVQLEQANEYSLTSLSNQQNWDQFDRHDDLPAALPSWVGLDNVGWAWRVLHLNHLNLLHLAYQACRRGVMSKRDLEGWVLKAQYKFRHFWSESPDEDTRRGREILRQLLRPEEGYTEEFRQWLVESRIVSPDLIAY
jgi:hypothetical protein